MRQDRFRTPSESIYATSVKVSILYFSDTALVPKIRIRKKTIIGSDFDLDRGIVK